MQGQRPVCGLHLISTGWEIDELVGVSWTKESVSDGMLGDGLPTEFEGVRMFVSSSDVSVAWLAGGFRVTVLPLIVLAASLAGGVKARVSSLRTLAASLALGVSGMIVLVDLTLEVSSSISVMNPPW